MKTRRFKENVGGLRTHVRHKNNFHKRQIRPGNTPWESSGPEFHNTKFGCDFCPQQLRVNQCPM